MPLAAVLSFAQVPREVLDADLAFAARTGDLESVRSLLQAGADPEARDEFGQPALLLAARRIAGDAHLEIIDLLLARGADIDAANRFGTTALMITQTPSRYLNRDEFFRKRGADFSKKDIFGGDYQAYTLFGSDERFPPSRPAKERKVLAERDVIWRFLLEGGLARLENPRCCGTAGPGATVVMGLAFYDYDYLFEEAVLADPSLLDETDEAGRAPLHFAAMGNCPACVYLGFPAGSGRLDAADRKGRTPVFYAALHGHDRFIVRVLRLGAKADVSDRHGNTPLGYAAAYGRASSVLALLAAGADPETTFDGAPALVAAARAGQESVVGMFATLKMTAELGLREGAVLEEREARIRSLSLIDFDVRDREGMTALMYAARSGSVKMAEFLIAAGADPALKDRNGMTAGEIATKAGHGAFVEFLKKKNE